MARKPSLPWRTQPASIDDPPSNEAELDYRGADTETPGIIMEPDQKPPGLGADDPDAGSSPEFSDELDQGDDAEDGTADDDEGDDEDLPDFLQRAKDAYAFSTSYMDSNLRKPLDDSLRAFNNQHAADSKYNSETFKRRSHLYRPKTRAVIRKNEAAAAAAFFSNYDLLNTEPVDPSSKEESVSAAVMKEILQQRLTIDIPWFKVAIGGFQDGQVQGVVAAHIYWKHRTRKDRTDGHVPVEDKPCVDLIPRENIRFDPSADWTDPVHTSPYLIHLIPMYVCDVKERMQHPDPKGQRWKALSNAELFSAKTSDDDSSRAARLKTPQDPAGQDRTISDYDVVWVHRHIHRWDGEDWEFYTLKSEVMLTDPAPLIENVWHGMRPYELGCCVLETHTTNPSSVPTLTREVQEAVNDVTNQRSDNVKFVLNKGYFVKRGKNVDTSSLVRNVPGRVTMVDDVEKDVKEQSWTDVTQSAYLEQDRLNSEFDDLAGNFSPTQVAQQRTARESFKTVNAIQSPAVMITEYMLKTYVETFLLPVLRQVVLLEQFYESDAVLIGIAGQKAKVAQRFGQSEDLDGLLEKRMTVTINIGMGATNPDTKLQRFMNAIGGFAKIAVKPPPAIDLKEVLKELLALAGYRDGQRFMSDQDPDKVKMQQQIAALTQKLKELMLEKKNKEGANKARVQVAREGNITKLVLAAKEDAHENKHLLIGHLMDLEKASAASRAQEQLQEQGAMQQQQGAQAQAAAKAGAAA
jgi:hypothetical protein